MLRVLGEDGARGKDWLRARGHHLCLSFFVNSVFKEVDSGSLHCLSLIHNV